ncbi:class I poly(R)-hydroxyalkanoic acid synthase [Xylophilus sp. GOD-11R]|uniref:PHA/PHB synthase family protein n=1 Tax=Xylophilus sp. GOD-11R TaxID=3089814 RepID=UPI00298CFE44|nr:class I poly(R)-hydroxyalkanoic acid synthase [Xylophilus sp. GOD-11R]WPB58238.1 class I poly(R)-hydroxyalkanoic acid synthase [Xylophilus sp. GOD-11R]
MDSEPTGPQDGKAAIQQATQAIDQMQRWWQSMLGAQAPGAGAAPRIDPTGLMAAQAEYLRGLAELTTAPAQAAPVQDRRFASPAWQQNPVSEFAARAHLLAARAMTAMADAVQADEKTRQRIRFAVDQWSAATAPSNLLALNADALQKAVETEGRSIAQGLQNLAADLRRGYVSQTDEQQFEVGRNVAITEGAVVFENDFFQLLEYKPLGAKVHARPILLVPPCINKYYILDLQPANSLIRHVVEQGHRTFVVSWRNPDETLASATWDDYIEQAVIRAIAVVREITAARTVNTLGFCVGGTMLATALAVLAARGEKPAHSLTLLTTFLDFSDTGVLDIFIDEQAVRLREMTIGKGGLLKGQELASTFSFLRPNELVWNYVVGNYLKGETPAPFDLLYWNSDATNLPGPFYAWYLRNAYLENRLCRAGEATVCGQPVDFGLIDIPAYLYGSREDHIVPVGNEGGGAYASTQLLPGPCRFVMGASGHIAGVINPPAKKKRSHWVRDDGKLPPTLAGWLQGAEERPGSWWDDWTSWLAGHAGRLQAAPKAYGGHGHAAIEPAPGRYVRQKA